MNVFLLSFSLILSLFSQTFCYVFFNTEFIPAFLQNSLQIWSIFVAVMSSSIRSFALLFSLIGVSRPFDI